MPRSSRSSAESRSTTGAFPPETSRQDTPASAAGAVIRRGTPGQRVDSPGSTEPTQRMLGALREAYLELTREIDVSTWEAGLNPTRFDVLETIAAAEGDGCSQSQIARRLHMSESNLCTLIDRMQTDGLVVRWRSQKDRRRSVLRLTDDGRYRLEAARRARDLRSRAVLDKLPGPTLVRLSTLLDDFVDFIKQEPGVAERPVPASPDAEDAA